MLKMERDRNLNYRLKLKIGQKITLPKLIGEFMKPRPAVVVQEYPTFYVVKTKAGYMETVDRYGKVEIKA